MFNSTWGAPEGTSNTPIMPVAKWVFPAAQAVPEFEEAEATPREPEITEEELLAAPPPPPRSKAWRVDFARGLLAASENAEAEAVEAAEGQTRKKAKVSFEEAGSKDSDAEAMKIALTSDAEGTESKRSEGNGDVVGAELEDSSGDGDAEGTGSREGNTEEESNIARAARAVAARSSAPSSHRPLLCASALSAH